MVVDLPYERFDLAGWLPNFTNEEYLACTPGTKAHRQMFVYRGDDGKNVYRNDETCGGIFMTQLYPSSTYPIRRQLKTLIYSALTQSHA